MTTADLAKLIGKTIQLQDPRTGRFYGATIADAKSVYGKLRIRCDGATIWFEPTKDEFSSISVAV